MLLMIAFIVTSGLQVDLLLVVISLIILIGYISEIVFKLTMIPEVLILMFIGILLGPTIHLLPTTYMTTLRSLTPLFGSIALIMIMFNGGRIIKLRKKILSDGTGYVLAFADILLSSAVLAVFMNLAFKWPLIYGGLLGIVVGETSVLMVIPLIKRVKIKQSLYEIITIETTFNSVFAILAFYLILAPISGSSFSALSYAKYILSYISIAVLVGLAGGMIWLFVQNLFRGARSYIATLAIAILLYSLVDLLNASAVVSVLIYAMIIGNSKTINKYLRLAREKETKYAIDVEHEMEFLVRTFFFVLLGVISFISIYYFLLGLVITAVLIAIRKIEVGGILPEMDKRYKDFVFSLTPRGLSVAVLSSIYYATGYPYSQQIFYIAFMTIILTNVAFSILASRAIKKF